MTSLAASGVTTYVYDAAGNQHVSQNPSNQRTTNSWDFENRLTEASLPSGVVNSFTYNGDGQRVQMQGSGATAKLVWDLQNVVVETDAGNTVQAVYTLEPAAYGNLISQLSGASNSFFQFDALDSTRQLTDEPAQYPIHVFMTHGEIYYLPVGQRPTGIDSSAVSGISSTQTPRCTS